MSEYKKINQCCKRCKLRGTSFIFLNDDDENILDEVDVEEIRTQTILSL